MAKRCNLPETVPFLKSTDFSLLPFGDRRPSRRGGTLDDWHEAVFGCICASPFYFRALRAIGRAVKSSRPELRLSQERAYWAASPDRERGSGPRRFTRRQLASIWNKAMFALGYTERADLTHAKWREWRDALAL